MTMSGRTPRAASIRVSAMSQMSTAGCVISVCRSCLSSRATVSASSLSLKTYDDNGLPRSGVMIRSASANVSATIGSDSRNGLSMLTYCEPWPV